jgi:hypothetical protein
MILNEKISIKLQTLERCDRKSSAHNDVKQLRMIFGFLP